MQSTRSLGLNPSRICFLSLPPNMTTFRVGANRPASLCQLDCTEVGTITRDAPSTARSMMTARASRVLPNPMSSARHAPTPQWASRDSHLNPST
ncbi:hypothetical protein MBAV_006293 [Candidatus Magnetobacterium bavaricum]|uniref:Uncharacterized protein n=1 Tax=Candidatus Magnetobacterium bavaricum TaxID=29290 RepID=A0A0F3GHU5_9BACT|nr:hypothetical protein MBAV_006293 [Candidatus Magnetobacterium bavaricum]